MFNHHLLTSNRIRDPTFHERAETVSISPIPLSDTLAVEITLLNLVFVTPWLLEDFPLPNTNGKFSYVNLFFETGSPRAIFF